MPGGVLDAELLGELGEIGELHLLEHADVERLGGLLLLAVAVAMAVAVIGARRGFRLRGRGLGDGGQRAPRQWQRPDATVVAVGFRDCLLGRRRDDAATGTGSATGGFVGFLRAAFLRGARFGLPALPRPAVPLR